MQTPETIALLFVTMALSSVIKKGKCLHTSGNLFATWRSMSVKMGLALLSELGQT